MPDCTDYVNSSIVQNHAWICYNITLLILFTQNSEFNEHTEAGRNI